MPSRHAALRLRIESASAARAPRLRTHRFGVSAGQFPEVMPREVVPGAAILMVAAIAVVVSRVGLSKPAPQALESQDDRRQDRPSGVLGLSATGVQRL